MIFGGAYSLKSGIPLLRKKATMVRMLTSLKCIFWMVLDQVLQFPIHWNASSFDGRQSLLTWSTFDIGKLCDLSLNEVKSRNGKDRQASLALGIGRP